MGALVTIFEPAPAAMCPMATKPQPVPWEELNDLRFDFSSGSSGSSSRKRRRSRSRWRSSCKAIRER